MICAFTSAFDPSRPPSLTAFSTSFFVLMGNSPPAMDLVGHFFALLVGIVLLLQRRFGHLHIRFGCVSELFLLIAERIHLRRRGRKLSLLFKFGTGATIPQMRGR